MQQQTTNLMQLTKLRHAAFLLFLLFGFTSPSVLAKSPSAMKADKEEVQRYLHGKYKIKEITITELDDTYRGLGHWRVLRLGAGGTEDDLTPLAVVAQGEQAAKNPRTVAKAFLAEEADLLDLTSASEMRERIRGLPVTTDERGFTSLSYDHYLGDLRLEGAGVGVTTGPAGTIVSATVLAVSITPALLQAVKQPGLPQTEIRRVIKKDLIATGLNPDKVTHLEDEKYAIPLPPYVVWEIRMAGEGLEYALTYVIDAFNGQIIRKQSSLRN